MKQLFIISLFVFTFFTVAAQVREHTSNTNGWYMYFGNHKLSEKIGLHAEVQLRRNKIISEKQQLLLRTGLDFYLPSGGRFTVGYGFIETHPYGEFAAPKAFPEHRIWQQYLTTQAIGKLKLTHRYRLEQRMIGNAATGKFDDGRYENRFRYMARIVIDLNKAPRPLYLALYDEILVNFGKEVGYNLFDQNRLYGALGLTLSKAIKLELGYVYQVVQLRSLSAQSRLRIEDNHTIQVGVYSTIPFFRAE
ncbi:MAG TPA: DUF2490 domain-containing protein [Chryseosolibacter sp.]|nr:DUF2490 domain-containing protein [Chryseosolibacter sp.]